jgi:hypothetical protein
MRSVTSHIVYTAIVVDIAIIVDIADAGIANIVLPLPLREGVRGRGSPAPHA